MEKEVRKLRRSFEIVIPPNLREELGWDEGNHVKIYINSGKLVIEKIEL